MKPAKFAGVVVLAALLLIPVPFYLRGAEEAKPESKWDVNNPPGPFAEATIRTDNGTWMSVDVSPQGDEIVFDLLGDLYTIPIGGGTAKSLTSGMAWDMQPRYSPDGKLIAFTSDRAGGDNIWTIQRDGSDAKQITKETFRLLNSPAWSPDSQYIVARKHFTAQRSLGAGEIWLYHTGGGDGLQLTKKANDQKDVGEPVFSPDGRYVYYSLDATPGSTFQYNKDPNAGIYAIRRLDRVSGEDEVRVDGPGGAIRPTPSPDGTRLAYIRRVRAKTVLYVQDLKSGKEQALFDGLDHDMQETWAIHGVYPGIAWTPDNKSIVFWAGGKIQRLDVASRQVTPIPFHMETKRKIVDAVRFPVDVAPARFHLKMLRWAETSPSGDSVVYQALGHLYLRPLPDGTPRRLTTQNDHFELFPSFSRDGQWIVYSSWEDEKLGAVRVVSVQGGDGRVLTPEPGVYEEPRLSPDGKTVVYRKTKGGDLLSPDWGVETGLYSIPVAGGEPVRVSKSGGRPQFGAASDRVFFIDSEDKKSVLKSVKLDGSEPRTHLLSENATNFRISPNEKWIAFTDRFQAYVAPFVATGKAIEIGQKVSSIPIHKVTRDAGEYLHWSGDSQRLHWSLGPELFTLELKNAFSFLEGSPEKLPEPPTEGRDISLDQNADVPSGVIALTGARLITMQGDQVIENGTVVVEGNRIAAVGASGATPVPAGATVIDATGKTIIPGIIDVHAHGSQGEEDIVPQRNWGHYAALAFGVTTTHDPSNDTATIFAAAEMARAGMITAPRIFSTGTILYGADTPFKAEINSLDDARSHLRRMKAVGAFSVKSYNQPRRDQRQQVIAAARELEMMVVPEGGSLFHHNMTMVADGHTGIEHAVPVARLYDDVIQFWSQSKSGYTPTLVVAYGGLMGENYWYQKFNVWENERLLRFVPRTVVDPRSRRRVMVPEDEFNHIDIARSANRLHDAGVSIQLGAHGQLQGLAPHWEIWMFVQGGMTPMEALRAATLNGARYLGLDKNLGSLEAGKLADLVVLDANPLENVRNTQLVHYTMANGRIFDAATMNEVGNHPRQRGKLYWESQ